MNRKRVSIEIEERLLDYLQDGEASMSKASFDLRHSPCVLFRVAMRLKASGLLDSKLSRSRYGRPQTIFFHARTKKAAA